ncbi:MAG: virulence RhuM family protein [Fibromonadales bacterium]|nr:virulence RhuM family protein [Fibromonadales bacterium]
MKFQYVRNSYELPPIAKSIDYDKEAKMTKDFFATVQNKMHWAISGQTAAEIIYGRADSEQKNMGLTSWRGSRIRKGDVGIAKNYLSKEEMQGLNDLVEQYLIFAQTQARARIPMTMKNWIDKLHGFLTLNDREILKSVGKISTKLAKEHAEKEYEIFRIKQAQIPYNTDFEEFAEFHKGK